MIEAFRCFYSDIPLVTEPGTRRSATWEHRTPNDESSVVLVADVVNKMKGNLTDAEFRRIVRALRAGSPAGCSTPATSRREASSRLTGDDPSDERRRLNQARPFGGATTGPRNACEH